MYNQKIFGTQTATGNSPRYFTRPILMGAPCNAVKRSTREYQISLKAHGYVLPTHTDFRYSRSSYRKISILAYHCPAPLNPVCYLLPYAIIKELKSNGLFLFRFCEKS